MYPFQNPYLSAVYFSKCLSKRGQRKKIQELIHKKKINSFENPFFGKTNYQIWLLLLKESKKIFGA